MSFVVKLLKQTRRSFKARHLAFRAASFVLAGGVAFLALSTTSPRVRAAYGSFAHSIFVQPLQKIVKARSASKRQALAERETTKKEVVRNAARQAGSLSSPYVEVGEDVFFPLLVRVWLNVDSSHTARVTNNDERFSLVYERAISEQGFVPVVGLTFGDNSFDIEIRDSNGKQVARHRLAARIEDKENVRGRFSVKKKATHNDFISAALVWKVGQGSSQDKPERMYYGVIDDLGDIRWLHRREGISKPWISFGVIFDKRIFFTYGAHKIFAADVFGNKEIFFDGKNASAERRDYYIHHDFTLTDKGTALLLADPKSKEGYLLSHDDIIVEVDQNNGKTIREINLKDSLGDVFDIEAGPKIEDRLLGNKPSQDWMHLNSIVYDSESNTILLSGRHQSAVFALDYKTGALQWMFADPEDFSAQQQVRFLTAPEGYVFHKGQHDAQLQGNRLRFFDNAVLVKKEDGSYRDIEATPSRIVEARLDLANKKITKIKTYAPKTIFSRITSGYDFRDGKYLVCYCGIMKDAFGGYITDPRHKKGLKGEVQLFEFEEDSNDELLHIFINKGISFRPRYFDWKEMVGAE